MDALFTSPICMHTPPIYMLYHNTFAESIGARTLSTEDCLSFPKVWYAQKVQRSGTFNGGVMERGVFAFACQYIVSLRSQTGNRTLTQMRHPLLVQGRPDCTRQSLASTLQRRRNDEKEYLAGRVKRGVGRGFGKRINRGSTLKFYGWPKTQGKQHFGKSHFNDFIVVAFSQEIQ